MLRQGEPHLDAASAISLGKRDCQEDAVISDFPVGGDVGLVVLSDGMGGHAAGDIASKIVITEVFSELKMSSGQAEVPDHGICDMLRKAANGANDCLRAYSEEYPDTAGMGATLVAAHIRRDRMHWISIGDSVLYLFRDDTLHQVNEDHSFGAQIDEMVRTGKITRELAVDHPDRHCLTSVVSGGEIARVDCPEAGLVLRDGDIVVVASDGLQFLEFERIRTVLSHFQEASSARIAARLLEEIERLGDPCQDNVSIVVLKVRLPARVDRARPGGQSHSLRRQKPAVEPLRVVPRSERPTTETAAAPVGISPEQVGRQAR
ncbi:PP2C family serine/threonine-protein phosphatase [Tropicimonas sp. IMCC6043]|uniref:PP2C family protein-serine/threonine phosphatase n=1 Tax=Tropicimonas sp. IMCC6043 TaxID=2510645 RepID=UPI00101BD196|nr:protein phosphatase 2C domain-containing protein [Tropicimonas sp. IMCC6043]RYH11258.1 serine/threonine-protein phosphatase [Tropicimonas sp. IMCC6043]